MAVGVEDFRLVGAFQGAVAVRAAADGGDERAHVVHDVVEVGVRDVDARVHDGDDAGGVLLAGVVPAVEVHGEAVRVLVAESALGVRIGPLPVRDVVAGHDLGLVHRNTCYGIRRGGARVGDGQAVACVSGGRAVALDNRAESRLHVLVEGGDGLVAGHGDEAVRLGPQHARVIGKRPENLFGGHVVARDHKGIHIHIGGAGRLGRALAAGGRERLGLRALERLGGQRLVEGLLVDVARGARELLGRLVEKRARGEAGRALAIVRGRHHSAGIGHRRGDDGDDLSFVEVAGREHLVDAIAPALLAGSLRGRIPGSAGPGSGRVRERRRREGQRDAEQRGERGTAAP